MHKIRDAVSIICIIGLFAWISFFAPFFGQSFTSRFIFVASILLASLLFLSPRPNKLIFNKQDIPFWIFFLTALGGLIGVKEPSTAYYYFKVFILPAPFLYLLAKTAFKEEYSLVIIRSTCIMALLVCIFGIVAFISKENIVYRYFPHGEDYSLWYKIFNGHRIMSAHVHPVPFGTYLAAIIPLAVILLFKEKNIFLKAFFFISTAIIFVSLFLTLTKGAILSVFAAICFMVVFLAKRKKWFFVSALISLIAAIFICISILPYPKKAIYSRGGLYRYSLQASYERFVYLKPRFKVSMLILKDHPFFGAGLGHYKVLFDTYYNRFNLTEKVLYPDKTPECAYLNLLTETGFIGLSGFLLFIWFLFKGARARLKSKLEDENKMFFIAFLAGFIGIMCCFLTYDGLYWTAPAYLFWTYAGIFSSFNERL